MFSPLANENKFSKQNKDPQFFFFPANTSWLTTTGGCISCALYLNGFTRESRAEACTLLPFHTPNQSISSVIKVVQARGLTPGEIKETICRMLAEDIADFHPSTAPDGETLVIYILSTVPRRTLPKSFPHFNCLYECNHICRELSERGKNTFSLNPSIGQHYRSLKDQHWISVHHCSIILVE